MTAVVMVSRGIYAARDVAEARNFAKGLLASLSNIDAFLVQWDPIVAADDTTFFDGVKRSAAEFKTVRTETVRLSTEVSPDGRGPRPRARQFAAVTRNLARLRMAAITIRQRI